VQEPLDFHKDNFVTNNTQVRETGKAKVEGLNYVQRQKPTLRKINTYRTPSSTGENIIHNTERAIPTPLRKPKYRTTKAQKIKYQN